jgi:dTDP-glucose 4,6-dehydratase
MNCVVTGGAGFIGSAFVRLALASSARIRITNIDKLTYAGNLENVAPGSGDPRYRFVRADIADKPLIDALFAEVQPDVVVHFAAESHVDRSILNPGAFVQTNVNGTWTLLEAARTHDVERFIHVSTDEVYGSLDEPIEADEEFPLRPSSTYSASKAGSDLLALSYHHTFGLPVIVTRASNNYGPYQFPEKLIPLMITNALEGKPLPVYGDGRQVRDWLFVDDHCRALLSLIEAGRPGEIYNIGGSASLTNLEVLEHILEATGASPSLIRHVADRPGHDRRYAISNEKLTRETAWFPLTGFRAGIAATAEWYRRNSAWIDRVKTGEYQHFYQRNYDDRMSELSRLRHGGTMLPFNGDGPDFDAGASLGAPEEITQ